MSNQLLNKYAEIISSLKASNGIKVVSVEEINDNEVFLRLKDSFESYFSEISETRLPLLILMDKIFTAVEIKSGYKLKVHNYLFFELPDGSCKYPFFQTVKTVDIGLLIIFSFHSIGVKFPKVSCGLL
jgi:hypothetical protein